MPLGTEACECRHCIPLPHLVLANSEEAVKDITPHHFTEQHFHLNCKICSLLWILLSDSLQSCFTVTQHLLLMSLLTKFIGETFNMVETIPWHRGQEVWNNLYPHCSALFVCGGCKVADDCPWQWSLPRINPLMMHRNCLAGPSPNPEQVILSSTQKYCPKLFHLHAQMWLSAASYCE